MRRVQMSKQYYWLFGEHLEEERKIMSSLAATNHRNDVMADCRKSDI